MKVWGEEEDWNNIVKMATFQCVWLGPKLENCSQIDSHESKSCIQEDSKVKAERTYRITLSFTPTSACRGKKLNSKLILRCFNYRYRRGGYDLFKETLCEDVGAWWNMGDVWHFCWLNEGKIAMYNIFFYFLHAIFSLWPWQGHGESRILIDPCQNLIMMTTIYNKFLFQRICNKYGGKMWNKKNNKPEGP